MGDRLWGKGLIACHHSQRGRGGILVGGGGGIGGALKKSAEWDGKGSHKRR